MATIIFESEKLDIEQQIIANNLSMICGKIFKCLPLKEEGEDCKKPLETIIIELVGMASLLPDQKDLFSLICKLQGLRELDAEMDFPTYRRTIFECCSLVTKVKESFGGV